MIKVDQVTLTELERVIERVNDSLTETPTERRQNDLLRNFKYLQRIRYGSMAIMSQVLAYKYYYRPRSVHTIINRGLDKIANPAFVETKISVSELFTIREHIKSSPYWMDGKRRHQDVQAAFIKWQSLGEVSFVCSLLGYIYYLRPNTVRLILKSSQL
ncbi:hypothetical protein [Microscilla marina]|uniref:Uncharacterized protein n=1 Tax=Microscilla marina ATCC 23134 TaxID=313606 RepID=A1ZYQ7_MICM2|nr:hypothetical protein [Microscilla marina]EAY24481.1 hypothetical protein M23134_06468 [Microscilla marina ATCC 23134]